MKTPTTQVKYEWTETKMHVYLPEFFWFPNRGSEEGFYEKAKKKQIETPKKLWNDGDESDDSIGGWTKSSKRNDEKNATK